MQDTMRNIGLHAPGRRHTRRDAPRAALLLASLAALLVFSGTAAAQASWRIDNISPVRSDRDGGDPNSASGGRVNQLAAHPTNNQIYFAASEWGGLFRTGDGGRNCQEDVWKVTPFGSSYDDYWRVGEQIKIESVLYAKPLCSHSKRLRESGDNEIFVKKETQQSVPSKEPMWDVWAVT